MPVAEEEYADRIRNCRVCHSPNLVPLLDLGRLNVSAFPGPDTATLIPAPLHLVGCNECSAVQLLHTVKPELLFQHDYWYASGINGTMREELRHVVREARRHVRVNDGDWVLDIGANDGTLLSAWREHLWEGKPRRFAVEPSPTFSRVLRDTSETVVTSLFPAPKLQVVPDGSFKVITSIAMFYAVPDPVGFAREVARLLHPEGVWVVQMQDLQQMLAATAFDNICHEHLIYYTIESFWRVCVQANLRIVDVQLREINGGSLRFTVMHALPGVGNFCPPAAFSAPPLNWQIFEHRMQQRLAALQDTVRAALEMGYNVDLLGASTKGNTLLQLAGLGPAQIRRCWERHPRKIGRKTITGIPIVSEERGRGGTSGLGTVPGDQAPDLLVCPIWQFRSALVEREHEFLKRGGKIYFPLPDGELYAGEPGS